MLFLSFHGIAQGPCFPSSSVRLCLLAERPREAACEGLPAPQCSYCSLGFPGGTGSLEDLHVEVVSCHAKLWQQCCLYSEGPYDLWCYKSWKTPSLPFIYNWKHSNWLQCQLKKQAAPLELHTHVRAHTCTHSLLLPARQCCVTCLNRRLKINQNYFQIRRKKKNPCEDVSV